MCCTPQEIEKKRREALQKLEQKGLSPVKAPVEENVLDINAGSFSRYKNPTNFQSKTVGQAQRKPYEKPTDKLNNTRDQRLNGNFYGNGKAIIATISLISAERFNIRMSSYFLPIIEVFKSVSSKNYDPKTRTWNFHIKDYDSFTRKMLMLKSQNVIIEPLPQFVVNCLKKPVKGCDIDVTKLDLELCKTLLPFQIEGFRFAVEREGRCLIADDMGLGKTFQALAVMNYYKSDWPLLIVTTASMKNIWEEIIFKYLSISVLQVQFMVSGKDYIGNSTILIVSHELMSRCCDKLLERNFGCIIIDESHNLKNYKTKSTQAAIKLAKNARRIVLLSGTPALSRPSELYTQLSIIDNKFFGSFIDYAKRYCDLQKTNFGLDSSGKSNLQELEIILNKKFMIRRTKEDVLVSLPKKTQEIIKLDVNLEKLDKESKLLLENLSQQYADTRKRNDKHALLLTFFCETAKIKLPSVCSYIYRILEKNTKFLVFAHHLIMLNALEQVLKKKNINYIRIDGSTTGEQRKYFVDKFQMDQTCMCALLSITAANSGITLTAAQLVVFAELHWNPSILSQAEARAHRMGQENPVIIQYLIASGTADDSIWPLLQEKQNILGEMGLCKDSLSDVNIKQQHTGENLKIDIPNFTVANTLDITSYFNSPENDKTVEKGDEDDVLNDGLDSILCSVEI